MDAVFLFTQPHFIVSDAYGECHRTGEEKTVSHGHARNLPMKSCAKEPNSALAAELCNNISST